jgi:anti-sigma factor RsiW
VSLSSANMLKLMAYVDGELEGVERTEAEMLLASNRDAATFVEQVAGLGELVELGHENAFGATIDAFDTADAVMAVILDEVAPAATARATNVTAIGAARVGRGGSIETKKSGGLKIGVAVAAALALAASVFVFAQHRSDEAPMALAPAPLRQAAPTGATGTGTGVAIESAGKSVSVFYLPTDSELTTSVVVWVDETGEK